jgi:hypothetical protein
LQVSLDGIKAQVVKVHVEGVGRTSEDLVLGNVQPIFRVRQFEELVLTAQDIRQGYSILSAVF